MECLVRRVEISPHPNADNLEIAHIDGFDSIVRKGDFVSGDLSVYLPEQAVIPEQLLRYMGLEGKLHGSGKNRVKAIKLRGVLSQGILLKLLRRADHFSIPLELCPGDPYATEGQDVGEILGVKKWEPTVPVHLQGRIKPIREKNSALTYDYGIPNIKHSRYILEGEEVSITEKLHGTLLAVGATPEGVSYVTSKGLLKQGVCLEDVEENSQNLYRRIAQEWGLNQIAQRWAKIHADNVIIFGEIYGPGVQDLTYSQTQPRYAMFDIRIGYEFCSQNYFEHLAALERLPVVPVLFKGIFTQEVLNFYTNGMETLSGSHMREGVVVKSLNGPRLIFKSLSEAYVLRKNGTEFH